VSGQGSPQRGEGFDAGFALEERGLVFAGGVDVDDNGEMVVEHGVDGLVELGHEGGLVAGVLPRDERAGVDREAAVVEAHGRDESDILRGGEAFEALRRVVIRLREPLAGVDAVLQVLRALEGGGGLILGGG